MDLLILILAGGLVGFAIGLTGVGGGSLMTPILLLMGYPAPVAIGTDLLYAGFTKLTGVYFHHLLGNIRWRIMFLLTLGSVPVSILMNVFLLDDEFRAQDSYEVLLTTVLGVMLIITSLVIIFQEKIQRRITDREGIPPLHLGFEPPYYGYAQRHTTTYTLVIGLVLGICVTLSSVGAGAFGAAVLFILYPKLKVVNIVATDIAHAVPLTLVAGLGYVYNGLVDFTLLFSLLCGSLPGIYLGSRLASKLSNNVMRIILVCILLSLGVYFLF